MSRLARRVVSTPRRPPASAAVAQTRTSCGLGIRRRSGRCSPSSATIGSIGFSDSRPPVVLRRASRRPHRLPRNARKPRISLSRDQRRRPRAQARQRGAPARLGLFASGFLRVEHDRATARTFSRRHRLRTDLDRDSRRTASRASTAPSTGPRGSLEFARSAPRTPHRVATPFLFAGADANPCVTILTEDRDGRMRLASSSGRTRRRSAGETRLRV
jgi:hypothetical protein